MDQDVVASDRGGVIENTHRVHAAVTDASGRLLFAVGNPSRLTLARSAAKPIQILALLQTEGFDRFNFDDADIALMCSSHSSEDRHIEQGQAMLRKVGADEADLRCGGHAALSDKVNRDWIKRSFKPGALCNNCSAKHIGMLAGARVVSETDAKDYHLPEHEIQRRVVHTFKEVSGLEHEEIKWGIDGCNLPAPALPLEALSYLYAVLAKAADAVHDEGSQRTSHHLKRIYDAMWRFPELVGGEGRFCTMLMLAHQGAVVGKLGADGCYGVAIRESDQTRRLGAVGGLGLAVKVEDGDIEILYAAVMEILSRLHIVSDTKTKELDAFHYVERVNSVGVITGKVSFPFRLRSC